MKRDKILRVNYQNPNSKSNVQYFTKEITLGEILDTEDIEMRRFLFIQSNLGSSGDVDIRRIDNDEKIAYYQFQDKYYMSKNGVIYTRSTLLEWIVYTKATKKVKLSRNCSFVYICLLQDHFSSRKIIMELGIKPTPTLCKKIIEGSISTIRDFVQYLRSYIIKKDIPLETIYKFVIGKRRHLLDVIEDPENATELSQLYGDVDFHITNLLLFKCKLKDLKNLKIQYDEWTKRQMSEFLRLQGSGDVPIGYPIDF